VEGLPRNFDLIDLLSSSPALKRPTSEASDHKQLPCGGCGQEAAAEKFCEQCGGAHLCVSCDTQLHALLLNRSHVRVASADAPEPRGACEHHQAKKVEMWCESDSVAVCMVCLVVGPHKGHDAITIEDAEQRLQEAARVELAQAMGELDTAVESEATRKAGEQESAREARAAIKQHFDRMREAVAQRERTLGAEVDEWERTRIKKAAKRRAKLAEIQTRLAAAGKAHQQQLQRYGFGRPDTADDWAAACEAARTAARGSQATSSSIAFVSKGTWAPAVASSGRLKRGETGAAGAGGVTCMPDYTAMTAAQHTLRCGIPLGVAVAATPGHIVVADYSSRLVHVLRAADRSLVRTLATTKASGVQLEMPWGVAVDHATGHIVVTDYAGSQALVWSANDGSLVRTFGSRGSGPGQFRDPRGVAVNKEGHIIVADSNNHRVQVWSNDGTFLLSFGSRGSGPGQFQHLSGVAVDPTTGNIIVADKSNHRVQVWRPDGSFIRSFGSRGRDQGQFMYPEGVAVDKEGHIIVADSKNDRVQVWRADGSFLCTFGSPGGGPAQFQRPMDVAIDAATGHIIVADWSNDRIQVW
jgi:DNA-binding beta-propeller fold protein YncE